jgi:hypothetical protein
MLLQADCKRREVPLELTSVRISTRGGMDYLTFLFFSTHSRLSSHYRKKCQERLRGAHIEGKRLLTALLFFYGTEKKNVGRNMRERDCNKKRRA